MNNTCIACGKILDVDYLPKSAEGEPNVWDCVVFRSKGQFGSRLTDRSFEIQVLVCDQCLLERGRADVVDGDVYVKIEDYVTTDHRARTVELLKQDGAYEPDRVY